MTEEQADRLLQMQAIQLVFLKHILEAQLGAEIVTLDYGTQRLLRDIGVGVEIRIPTAAA